jgi:alpha-galactosidase
MLDAHGEALLGDGRVLSTDSHPDLLSLSREDSAVRLGLRNSTSVPMRVEQLRWLVAEHGYANIPLRALRILQTGWQSWSRAHPPAPFEPNQQLMAPPIRGPHLPHRHPASQLEPWMAVLEADGHPSLLVGFLGATEQLGTIEILPSPDGGHSIVAATELEGIELAPGAEVVSEPLLVQEGVTADLIDLYAQRVAEHMRARHRGDVLTGWCSWYQLYTTVSEAAVERNLASLSHHRNQLPLRLIQLDDGYQHAVGDWLELNEKFPSGMRALVGRIRDAGFMPGLWLAPFLLSERSHTYARHPDWVVRDANGPLNAIDNWGCANFAVDTTHPDVLAWLREVIRTVCADWGFDYLKLDFLYAAAMRGHRFNANFTSAQAYRHGLRALREIAGERFILGCGAPLLPSIGLVDGMRIGSDVAAYWGGEGNSDGPSLRNATRATLARLWMHDRWWINDPDCLVVRAADTELSLAEVEAWAGVVAMSGGMVFVGDDLSQLDSERLRLIQRLLPPSGQAARAREPLVGHLPERLHLPVQRDWGAWDVVGIANWSDAPRQAAFDPADFDLQPMSRHVVDLWTSEYLGLYSGSADLGVLPPHAMRLLSIHADPARPTVIGSTGHVLGDVMDLADEHWDAAERILILTPSTSAQTAEFLVADGLGGLRHVPFTGGSPVAVRF